MSQATQEEIVAGLKELVTEIEAGTYPSIAMITRAAIEEKRISSIVISQLVGKTITIQLMRRQDGEAQSQN